MLLRHLLLSLLLLASALRTSAESDRLTETELEHLPWRIQYVINGGRWQRGEAHGYTRLLVTTVEWAEYTRQEVFLQWVRTEEYGMRISIEGTIRIPEFDGYSISDAPRASGTERSAYEVATRDDLDFRRTFLVTPHADHSYTFGRTTAWQLFTSLPFLLLCASLFIALSLIWLSLRRQRSSRADDKRW